MKKVIIGIILMLLIIAVAAGYFLREDATMERYNNVARHILDTHKAGDSSSEFPAACGTLDCTVTVAAQGIEEEDEEDLSEKEEIYTMFQADERGNLVLNETTRLNIERLYALNTPEELEEKYRKLSRVLPDNAHRQVVNLVDYFDKYTLNVKEIYPPDMDVETVEEVLVELKGIHDLRRMHFGADVARAFYADEEKISLQLVYLMAIEKDKKLSLDEKVQKAQQLLDSSPELAAAYDPDRD